MHAARSSISPLKFDNASSSLDFISDSYMDTTSGISSGISTLRYIPSLCRRMKQSVQEAPTPIQVISHQRKKKSTTRYDNFFKFCLRILLLHMCIGSNPNFPDVFVLRIALFLLIIWDLLEPPLDVPASLCNIIMTTPQFCRHPGPLGISSN